MSEEVKYVCCHTHGDGSHIYTHGYAATLSEAQEINRAWAEDHPTHDGWNNAIFVLTVEEYRAQNS